MWSLSLFYLLVLSWTAAAAKNKPIQIEFPETPPASAQHNIIYDNFLGISWELSSFDTLWGETPEEMPRAMQNYLSNIRARMSSPLRIRVGGNGMDGSTYVPSQDSMITFTDPGAYFNDIPVKLGHVFFDVLNAMSDSVGEMKFLIGLSMRNPSEDSNVLDLATAAENALGDRLDAMMLGNEPDLYAGHGNRHEYNLSTYIPEIGKVVEDLRNASLLSKDMLAGPTTCCDIWPLEDIINGLDKYPYKYYTVQHYPQNICQGPNDKNTNMTFYLDHAALPPYVNSEQVGVDLAMAAGVPVLLTEYNSVSCGGSNISDTFAMSLWTTDVALKFASNNYSGTFLHTREYGVKYNLFDPPSITTSTEAGWRTGSPYYTELIIPEALSKTGSVVVDLNLENSSIVSGVNTTGYGVWDNGGKSRGKLVLINRDDEEQVFVIPGDITDAVSLRYLLAPSVWEQTNISWAGQTVGKNGELEGDQDTEFIPCSSGCNVTVPGPGLALVLLDSTSPDSFYEGNSSIGGLSGYQQPSSARVLYRDFRFLVTVLLGLCLLFHQ